VKKLDAFFNALRRAADSANPMDSPTRFWKSAISRPANSLLPPPTQSCSSSIGRAIQHATLAERIRVPLNGRRVRTRERIANCEECRARVNYRVVTQITEPFRSAPSGPDIIIRGLSASGGAGALSLIVDFRVASRIQPELPSPVSLSLSFSLSLSLSSPSNPIVGLAAGSPVRGERAEASASVP